MKELIITVYGANIQSIVTNDQHITVKVLDYDNIKEGCMREDAQLFEELEYFANRHKGKDWKDIRTEIGLEWNEKVLALPSREDNKPDGLIQIQIKERAIGMDSSDAEHFEVVASGATYK